MATLEDKLLGEKLQYYCSSSEEEDNGDDEKGARDPRKGGAGLTINTDPNAAPAGGFRSQGSMNTGPKGVVKDWQRFKQLEGSASRGVQGTHHGVAQFATGIGGCFRVPWHRKECEKYPLPFGLRAGCLRRFGFSRLVRHCFLCGAFGALKCRVQR